MHTFTRWLLVAFLATVLGAKDQVPDDAIRYAVSYTFTGLNAAAGLLTVSVPPNSNNVYLIEAVAESTVAMTAAQNLNGTVTNGTNVTPVQLNHPGTFTNGITVKRDATIAAGSALPSIEAALVRSIYRAAINLEHIALKRSSTAQSYTISTGTITGDATITIIYAVAR